MATVLVVAPHQDDEILPMGVAIRKHLRVGHDVHVLCLTTGVNSGARAATGLSRSQFTRARDDEMCRAVRTLGVRNPVLFGRHSVPDGALTVQTALDSISWALDTIGWDAWVKCYSNLPAPGRHADHITSGLAGLALMDLPDFLGNVRMYVEPWAASAFREAHPTVNLLVDRPAETVDRQAVVDGLNQYCLIDPLGGYHGIGYLSVPSYFNQAKADPVSYWYVPQ